MKKVITVLFAIIICQAVRAQEVTVEDRVNDRLEKMDQKLNLSDTQETNIREILLTNIKAIKDLKSAETVDNEAVKALRKKMKDEIKGELTEEQIEKMKEDRKSAGLKTKEERRAHMKENKHRGKSKPLLKAERKTFESLLTEEEKNVVENARLVLAENKKEKRDSTEKSKEQKKLRKVNRDKAHQMLIPVVENHRQELMEVESRVKAVKESKEENPERTEKPKNKKPSDRFYYRFLLMKP